jgi:Family of unknown function (DUF6518)
MDPLPIMFVIVVGIFLGIPVAELTGFLPPPWYFLAQLAAPWLVASFVAGYLCRRVSGAAIAGSTVLAVGLVSQVAYKTIVYGAYSVRPLMNVIGYWVILALGLGSFMGSPVQWPTSVEAGLSRIGRHHHGST